MHGMIFLLSYVGGNQVSSRKLEFKHRLSIAHGAAKGVNLVFLIPSERKHFGIKSILSS